MFSSKNSFCPGVNGNVQSCVQGDVQYLGVNMVPIVASYIVSMGVSVDVFTVMPTVMCWHGGQKVQCLLYDVQAAV